MLKASIYLHLLSLAFKHKFLWSEDYFTYICVTNI